MAGTKGGKTWITLPHPDEDFTANPVELFFDLAYVFAFSQLVGRLIDHHNGEEIARVGLLFFMLWLPWTQFTWATNAVSGHSRPVQAIMLIATATSVPMAASVREALDDGGPIFAISLSIILAMGLALLLIGHPTGSPEFYSALQYSIPNVVAMGFFVAGAFVGEAPRIALWVVGLFCVLGGTVKAGDGDFVVRAGHFAERHGLIIIIALGEVIVAIAIPVVANLEKDKGLPGETIAALFAAGLFAALLWWSYFDRPAGVFEHRLADEEAGRASFARDVYTYLHAFIVAGIIFSAAALEEVTLHPKDGLDLIFRVILLLGLGLFFGGIEGGVLRAFHVFPPERAVAVAAMAVLLLAGGSLDGLWLLVIVDLIILVTLVLEGRRIGRLTAAT